VSGATFKQTALSVLTDIAREIMRREIHVPVGRSELREDDQQRLFNATVACVELGASHDEIGRALCAGLEEGR